jgi:hypothetical protein
LALGFDFAAFRAAGLALVALGLEAFGLVPFASAALGSVPLALAAFGLVPFALAALGSVTLAFRLVPFPLAVFGLATFASASTGLTAPTFGRFEVATVNFEIAVALAPCGFRRRDVCGGIWAFLANVCTNDAGTTPLDATTWARSPLAVSPRERIKPSSHRRKREAQTRRRTWM